MKHKIPVGLLLLQICGQIDDSDCLEGTLFDADAAANAQILTEEGDF